MTGSETGCSHGIAEWRGAVELFFEQEWEQLRQLILELEAGQWDQPQLPSPATQPTNAVTENTSAGDGRMSNPGAEPGGQDRLAELAENLQRKLHGNESSPISVLLDF